ARPTCAAHCPERTPTAPSRPQLPRARPRRIRSRKRTSRSHRSARAPPRTISSPARSIFSGASPCTRRATRTKKGRRIETETTATMQGRGLAAAWGVLALVVLTTVAWLALTDTPGHEVGTPEVTVDIPAFPEPAEP